MSGIEPAVVAFEGEVPVSATFGDVYFDASRLEGARRMFLAPASMRERAAAASVFTIGELGFGTGLNFLAACAHLSRARVPGCRVHFISFERHPLCRDDLVRALAPVSSELATPLIEAYPPPVAGWHRRFFDEGRVQLSVWVGDVAYGLEDLCLQQRRGVDAWLLDGFAPAKNPEMWRPGLFEAMAECSAPGASVTTFTAAGEVRRNLQAAGFDMRRLDQQPLKRHSLAGWLVRGGRTHTASAEVRVVGAGLAGAATARCLADKGMKVHLWDAGRRVAAGASRIPAALLHGRLLGRLPGDGLQGLEGLESGDAEAMLRLHAYLFSGAAMRRWDGARATPMLQLSRQPGEDAGLANIAAAYPASIVRLVEASEASVLAGVALGEPGLLFEQGLIIDGGRLVEELCRHEAIHWSGAEPERNDMPTVYATGFRADAFPTLEVTALGGQVDRFRPPVVPRIPIVGRGSFAPDGGDLWVGATFEYRPWPIARATDANAQRYRALCGVGPGASTGVFRGRRAVTSDRLPVVGEHGGAWVNLGHGSHGTNTAPFAAECIASALAGELPPVHRGVLRAMAPGRFEERQRRRPNPFVGRGRVVQNTTRRKRRA